MNCPFETDVLDLVAIDQWPQRADESLRAHVAQCALCAEVAAIAGAVREWNDAAPLPRMPEASVVWHRAQVKARSDAARAAAKPVWVAQGLGLIALVAALVWMGPSASWYAGLWQGLALGLPSVSASVPQPPLFAENAGSMGLMTGWGPTVLLAVGGVLLFVTLAFGALKLSEQSELSK